MNSSPYIISWNLNSASRKLPFLQHVLCKYNPVAICLQETKLTSNMNFTLKSRVIFRRDEISLGNAKGGVLIAVQRNLQANEIAITTTLQAIAVRIHSRTPFTLCSIYIPPNSNISRHLLKELLVQLPTPYILTGDFNAHNQIWGSATNDQSGHEIEALISAD